MSNKVAETSAHYFAKDGVEVASDGNKNLPKVPRGFKQTEVGVIPEDWEASTIGQVTIWSSGGTPNRKRDDFWAGQIPWISGSTLKSLEVFTSDQFLTKEGVEAGSKMAPINGTLLLVRGSALHNCIRAGLVISPVSFNQDVKCLFPRESVLPKYLTLYIMGMENELLALVSSAGNSAGVLDTELVKKFKFLLPSIKEQTAISNALSDVDALITSLEKLIAKKRAIKTATMQQLLTGKKRLPPFDTLNTKNGTPRYKKTELGEIPDDWEVVGLGVLFESTINRRRLTGQEDVTFIGMQDVTETARIAISHKIKYSEIKSGFTYFEKNDVLVAKITPCFENGKGGYADSIDTQVGFGSTEFHVLRARTGVDSKYLYYFTNTTRFRSELEGEMVGSAGHRRVPFSSLQKYRVAATLNLKEQNLIASVLSDMDKEIGALEQRLNKTQQIKQGMMQELLTGKTRLVECTA